MRQAGEYLANHPELYQLALERAHKLGLRRCGCYARVSTDGQTLTAQQANLTAAGCERVYAEKQSGAKTDRWAKGTL
jgi:hypothetical protein